MIPLGFSGRFQKMRIDEEVRFVYWTFLGGSLGAEKHFNDLAFTKINLLSSSS